MVVQRFTLQELAKFKAADPDDVVSVRVGQTVELIEQYEQLSRVYAQVSADKVGLEEEIAEYKSNVAVLEQRISDLDRSSKLNSHNSSKPPLSDGLSKETVEKKKEKRTKNSRKNPIASLVVKLVIRERPRTRLKIRTKSSNILLTSARSVVRCYRSQIYWGFRPGRYLTFLNHHRFL